MRRKIEHETIDLGEGNQRYRTWTSHLEPLRMMIVATSRSQAMRFAAKEIGRAGMPVNLNHFDKGLRDSGWHIKDSILNYCERQGYRLVGVMARYPKGMTYVAD